MKLRIIKTPGTGKFTVEGFTDWPQCENMLWVGVRALYEIPTDVFDTQAEAEALVCRLRIPKPPVAAPIVVSEYPDSQA